MLRKKLKEEAEKRKEQYYLISWTKEPGKPCSVHPHEEIVEKDSPAVGNEMLVIFPSKKQKVVASAKHRGTIIAIGPKREILEKEKLYLRNEFEFTPSDGKEAKHITNADEKKKWKTAKTEENESSKVKKAKINKKDTMPLKKASTLKVKKRSSGIIVLGNGCSDEDDNEGFSDDEGFSDNEGFSDKEEKRGMDYDSDPIAICKSKKKRKEVVTMKCDGEPKSKKKRKEVIAMKCDGSEQRNKKKNEVDSDDSSTDDDDPNCKPGMKKENQAMKCDGSDAKTKKKGKEVIAMTCGGSEPRSKKKNEVHSLMIAALMTMTQTVNQE
ncbi:protein FAM133-like [Dysidea avara]|uniref:protein FAM133-like n=1 Tax=Dysidea avara TaxID=196820 RepID=UPI003319C0B4